MREIETCPRCVEPPAELGEAIHSLEQQIRGVLASLGECNSAAGGHCQRVDPFARSLFGNPLKGGRSRGGAVVMTLEQPRLDELCEKRRGKQGCPSELVEPPSEERCSGG